MKYFSFFVLLVVASANLEASTKVVCTGDSLTGMYSFYFPGVLQTFGDFTCPNPVLGNGGSNTSLGGIGSSAYIGLSPVGTPPAYVDFRNNCIAANPDVLCLMLGINECFSDSGSTNNQLAFQNYKNNMDIAFQSFTAQPFKTVIGSITPVNDAVASAYRGIPNQHANERIDQYNAWLEQEANQYGFLYLDNNALMKQVPNWDTTMFGVDGLHYAFDGSYLLCKTFSQCADILTQDNPVVIIDIKVNSLNVQTLQVKAILTADSIVADTLTIGSGVHVVPEPSMLVLIFIGISCLWTNRIGHHGRSRQNDGQK